MSRRTALAFLSSLLALATLFPAGCRSPAAATSVAAPTLAADHRLPAGDIERFYPPGDWQRLRRLEYAAVVVMDGFVRSDGSLHAIRVRRPYPNPPWITLARSYVPEISLHAATIGSNLEPAAELYVVFFRPGFDGNLVLIYARQTGAPPPGMTGRAVYFHTTHY